MFHQVSNFPGWRVKLLETAKDVGQCDLGIMLLFQAIFHPNKFSSKPKKVRAEELCFPFLISCKLCKLSSYFLRYWWKKHPPVCRIWNFWLKWKYNIIPPPPQHTYISNMFKVHWNLYCCFQTEKNTQLKSYSIISFSNQLTITKIVLLVADILVKEIPHFL